jgi:hypothetical protein
MKIRTLGHVALFSLAALLVGCTGTKIIETTVFENTGPVDLAGTRVAVLALAGEENMRKDVEGELVAELDKRGIEAVASYAVVPVYAPGDRGAVKAALTESGADLLVALDLLGTEEETRYESADPYGDFYFSSYYNSYLALYDHYTFSSPFVWERTYTTYIVATMIYRVADEELVWKAISESFAPAGTKGFAREITQAASEALRKDGLLK